MNARTAEGWQKDFGLDKRNRPNFFSNKDDLNPKVPQAHVLRHAFDLLKLDGILCSENAPLIYFKLVPKIRKDQVLRLHRQFWNHGGAPILVLVSGEEVQVYSGMSRPISKDVAQDDQSALVKTLGRVSDGLQEFLVSVESGEFFRQYARSFNPDHRVDHDLLDNLRNARDVLDENSKRNISPSVLDALLCRLVFTCYLFDREVIGENYLTELGFEDMQHLKDILRIEPISNAKIALYKLFKKLGEDFNGDLFSDDLEVESRKITNKHIQILNEFFHGTDVRTGQQKFWPYDFGFIPIETISAIYEHFLKAEDQRDGAFYTPRFLAEIVLDMALEKFDTLLGKKFLDPACGSGIFLVGVFNRIAEEWKQKNPHARNDRRAKELMILLKKSLFGIDTNPTACRITAFSLYLAFLDQLTPRNIQALQKRGRALPPLVIQNFGKYTSSTGNIRCGDFFENLDFYTTLRGVFENVDLVVGNPPWGSLASKNTPAGQWCAQHRKPIADNQIASAFVWKATEHISARGQVCFVLPHGTLFNHRSKAIQFQKAWVSQHTIQRVLNLSDLRQFLFNEAIHPAIVVSYRDTAPSISDHRIEYWSPKADWAMTQVEVISIAPTDRTEISLRELLRDLDGPDAPQIWKNHFWASSRDLRLIDRLSLYPRLRDHVRQAGENNDDKAWVMAEGFQPFGENDPERSRKILSLPNRRFVQARSQSLDLFLLREDCETLPSSKVDVRRTIRNTNIFRAPHVIISKGGRVAFANFDVSFRHALRGIHGSKEDRNLLIFLAAYLRTSLAKFFMFHTSSNWGVYRPEVHVQEILRLPMPLPEQMLDKTRSQQIVDKVAHIVDSASSQAGENFLSRTSVIERATAKVEPLIEEYFDIRPLEKILIEDTLNITIPSIQPTLERMPTLPTMKHSSIKQQSKYMECICSMLNKWAKNSQQIVRGKAASSDKLGIGIVVLEKISHSKVDEPVAAAGDDLLRSIDRLRKAIPRSQKTIDPVRGLMVFDGCLLYVVKPIGQRFWTQTAALNDADEIAGTILMHSFKEKA